MDNGVDFSIYDHTGKLTAVAEAKKKPGITRTWAAKWARNFRAHEHRAAPAYLLLVTPDHVYLWDPQKQSAEADPTYIFDANSLFQSYLSRPVVDPERMSPQAFELLVGSWLQAVLQRDWSAQRDRVAPLAQSGFLDAVKGGHVESAESA
jgi:hypothetical protein